MRLEYRPRAPDRLIGPRIAVVVRKGEDLVAGDRDCQVLRTAQCRHVRAERPDGNAAETANSRMTRPVSSVEQWSTISNSQPGRGRLEAGDRAEEPR